MIKIHLRSKPGLYTVIDYDVDGIHIETKKEAFTVPPSDFSKFAGGGWNQDTDLDEFIKYLNNHKVKVVATPIKEELEPSRRSLTSRVVFQNYDDNNPDAPF